MKIPPLWVFCLPSYSAHDASCVILNTDWTPLPPQFWTLSLFYQVIGTSPGQIDGQTDVAYWDT